MRYIKLCENGVWNTYALRLVAEPTVSRPIKPTPLTDAATTWLRNYLADGPKQSADVHSAAARAGHTSYAVRKATARLEITATKHGITGGWIMRLADGPLADLVDLV